MPYDILSYLAQNAAVKMPQSIIQDVHPYLTRDCDVRNVLSPPPAT